MHMCLSSHFPQRPHLHGLIIRCGTGVSQVWVRCWSGVGCVWDGSSMGRQDPRHGAGLLADHN